MADSYQEEIKQKMDALPASVRDYIYSSDMDASIRAIGVKHQLHIDQVGALGTESVAVMIGISETKDFVSEVADSLNISAEKAAAIAEDVNKDVFVKIREAMKKGPPAASAPRASTPPPKPSTPPPAPVSAPKPQPPKPVQPPQPKPLEAHPADLMLTQKTVSVAPQAPKPQPPAPAVPKPAAPIAPATPAAQKPAAPPPPAPQPYKADPYREPAE